MSLSNNNNRPVENVLSNFYAKRQEELLKKARERERESELEYNNEKNTIQIHRSKIPRLKAMSGLLNTLINKNFKNSNNYFNNEGNYFLDRNILPEKYFSEEEYPGRWNALREAIEDGSVSDPKHREFIEDFFLFKSSLTPHTVITPQQGYFVRNLGKKGKQKLRRVELKSMGYYNNNLNENNERSVRKAEERAEREAETENLEAMVENMLGRNRLNKVLSETKKAKAERSKYPKSGKRPSKTSRTTLSHNNKKQARQTLKARRNSKGNNNA
jgi:hypothetical protein